ncbi:unnamed protein product [Symbiodinium sp. CCMP2592]|nr:unnamed protein product [Symbiodinium sp. CCMP2592]
MFEKCISAESGVVFRKHFVDCFANDIFLKGLKLAENHIKNLTYFLTHMHHVLQKYVEMDEWQALIDAGDDAKPFTEAVTRIWELVKALLTMLLASPEREGLAAKNMLSLLNYKGPSVLENSIKSLLSDHRFWTGAISSTNKFAATGKLAFPKLKALEDHIKNLKSGEFDATSWLDATADAFKQLPDLREKLKPNATKRLEQYLRQMVDPIARHITSATSPEGLAMRSVEAFMDGVKKIFASDESLAGTAEKLGQWQAKMAGELVLRRVLSGLADVVSCNKADWVLLSDDIPRVPDLETRSEITRALARTFHIFLEDFLKTEMDAGSLDNFCIWFVMLGSRGRVGNRERECGPRSAMFRPKLDMLQSAVVKSNHPAAELAKQLLLMLTLTSNARDSLASYEKLGPSTAQRVRRDASGINLANVAKIFLTFDKTKTALSAGIKKVNEEISGYEKADQEVVGMLLTSPVDSYITVDWSVLIDALNAVGQSMVERISMAVSKTACIVQEKQLGGKNDWRRQLPDTADGPTVLRIGAEALKDVEGKTLGDAIEVMEEALCVSKAAEQTQKNFGAVIKCLRKQSDSLELNGWNALEEQSKILQTATKGFRMTFCEGLVMWAATSTPTKAILASLRAQEALIAGEVIDEACMHPKILEKLRELLARGTAQA